MPSSWAKEGTALDSQTQVSIDGQSQDLGSDSTVAAPGSVASASATAHPSTPTDPKIPKTKKPNKLEMNAIQNYAEAHQIEPNVLSTNEGLQSVLQKVKLSVKGFEYYATKHLKTDARSALGQRYKTELNKDPELSLQVSKLTLPYRQKVRLNWIAYRKFDVVKEMRVDREIYHEREGLAGKYMTPISIANALGGYQYPECRAEMEKFCAWADAKCGRIFLSDGQEWTKTKFYLYSEIIVNSFTENNIENKVESLTTINMIEAMMIESRACKNFAIAHSMNPDVVTIDMVKVHSIGVQGWANATPSAPQTAAAQPRPSPRKRQLTRESSKQSDCPPSQDHQPQQDAAATAAAPTARPAQTQPRPQEETQLPPQTATKQSKPQENQKQKAPSATKSNPKQKLKVDKQSAKVRKAMNAKVRKAEAAGKELLGELVVKEADVERVSTDIQMLIFWGDEEDNFDWAEKRLKKLETTMQTFAYEKVDANFHRDFRASAPSLEQLKALRKTLADDYLAKLLTWNKAVKKQIHKLEKQIAKVDKLTNAATKAATPVKKKARTARTPAGGSGVPISDRASDGDSDQIHVVNAAVRKRTTRRERAKRLAPSDSN